MDFAQLPCLFKFDVEWLGNISQLPQNPGMHVVRSHELLAIQLHQVVLNLLFSHNGRDFTPAMPTWRFRDLRDVQGLEILSW